MSFFASLVVNGSALASERLRVDLASANLANANSTRTPEGGPYRRRDAVLRSVPLQQDFGSGLERAMHRVEIRGVRIDSSPPRRVFNPAHPDADTDGMVSMPNVQVTEEMVNLMNAQRSFEANVQALSIGREMANRALRIGRSS